MIATVVLIVGFMLLLAVVGDAKSGQIRATQLTLLALAALPVLIAAVFYAEFRSRNKRRVRQSKERGAKGYLSAKC